MKKPSLPTKPNLGVPQSGYAVFIHKGIDTSVWTTNVRWCTALVGYDKKNHVAFLCHFASPFSVWSMPAILKHLRGLQIQGLEFESYLYGGKWWFWSCITRWLIAKALKSDRDLFPELPKPRKFSPCGGLTVQINSSTGARSAESGRPEGLPKKSIEPSIFSFGAWLPTMVLAAESD